MFEDTVEDAVCSTFLTQADILPTKQHISGVCNHSFFTMCRLSYFIIRVSAHLLQDVSGTDFVGYC